MDNLNEIKETLKDMFKAAITNAKDGDEKGEWITINGTHVFIPEGKTAEDVIKEKGWKQKGDGKEKSDKPKDNPSEGKKEIQHLNISGGVQALSNYAFSAHPTQVKRLEEKGEVPKGVYGNGGSAGKTAVFKALLHKHRNETLGQICEALNKSDITYRNWQPADGYDKDDKIIDFGKQGAELWAKNYDEKNWKTLYLSNNDKDNTVKNGLSEIIKNCKPETEEDLKILKGLKDILEEQ